MRLLKLFGPTYIESVTLEQSIRSVAKLMVKGGSLLDIGCGNKPYKKYFPNHEYVGIDFQQYSFHAFNKGDGPEMLFPKGYENDFRLTNIPSGSKDAAVSFQVLEHHQEPETFFREAKRILKRGGLLLVTVPMVWELHEEPNDFWRFTEHGIIHLATKHGFSPVLIKRRGGPLAVVHQAILNALKKRWQKLLFLPLYLCSPLTVAIEDWRRRKPSIYLGMTCLFRKK